MKKFMLLIVLVLASSGCSPQSLEQSQAALNDARATYNAERMRASTLPTDSPDRLLIEKNAPKVDEALVKAQAALDIAKAASNGDAGSVGATAAQLGIPYVGLALAVIGLIERELKRARAQKALEQVVTSVDAALPVKTAEQVKTMDAIQDGATRKAVAAVRVS